MFRRKAVIIGLSVFAPFWTYSMALSQRIIPNSLLPAAERAIHEFLSSYPRDQLVENQIILPCDDIDKVSLGDPFSIYSLDINKARVLEKSDSFKEALTFIAWGFPVCFDGEPRTSMRMINVDGKWVWGETGRDASPIVNARMRWKESDGYEHSYVLSVQDFQFFEFIMLERNENIQLYPLRQLKTFDVEPEADGTYHPIQAEYIIDKLKLLPPSKYVPKLE